MMSAPSKEERVGGAPITLALENFSSLVRKVKVRTNFWLQYSRT